MNINCYMEEHPGILESVMKDMRCRFGCDEDDTSKDEKILTLPPREFLREWLNWNGLYEHTDMIIESIYMAYGICLEDYPFERDIKREIEEWQ